MDKAASRIRLHSCNANKAKMKGKSGHFAIKGSVFYVDSIADFQHQRRNIVIFNNISQTAQNSRILS